MTKKVKVFLAVLLIISAAGMGYSFHSVLPQTAPARSVRDAGVPVEGAPETADLAAPRYIIAGEGTYEYKIADRKTELPEDIVLEGAGDNSAYASFLRAVEQILGEGAAPETADAATENIISESFSQRSLTALFEYEVPLSEFLSFYGVRGSARQPDTVSRISLLADGSLLLYRGSDQTCCRYPAPAQEDSQFAQALAKYIQYLCDTSADTPWKLQSVTSLTGIENNTYIPVNASAGAEESVYGSAFHAADSADQELLKSFFFPDGMDFINEITTADGTRIYMYGSGKRVLRFSPSGNFLYREEPDLQNYRSCGFYEALDAVVSGLFQTSGLAERLPLTDMYLRDVEELTADNRGGYRFVFGAAVNGMDIMLPGEPLLSVEVCGKQIISVTGNIPDVSLLLNNAEAPGAAVDGMELIRNSSDAVAAIILQSYEGDSAINTEKYTSNDNFYAVAASISEARLCLVALDRPPVSGEETEEGGIAAGGLLVIPSWYFTVDGMEFWFDVSDGTLLTYRKITNS